MKWKKYKKGDDYSYAFGAFPTGELLAHNKEQVVEILFSEDFHEKEEWIRRLEQEHIAYRVSDKAVQRLANKGNIYVIGVFRTQLEQSRNNNHVVLDHISDMGNLGNIIRTMLAMDCYDLITIGSCCDIYDPRTVRASMGAVFSIRHSHFESYEEYRRAFPEERNVFCFLLAERGSTPLPNILGEGCWSLIFGNEGSGLAKEYEEIGTSVRIPQSEHVDSLNLTTAVAIGLYHFQYIK